MKFITFILFLFCNLEAHALFQEMLKRYNKSNRLNGIKSQDNVNKEQAIIENNKYGWALSFNASNSKSALDRLFAFQSLDTTTNTYGFQLEKTSFKYGVFRIIHSQVNYDLSKWGEENLTQFSDDQQYESRNTFEYSYEIFNKKLVLELDEINLNIESRDIEQDIKVQEDHFNFFSSYVFAKQGIMLDRLYNEFENRALERVALVKKRVRDGLSRNVSLNQARLSLLNQKETIIQNTNNLREKVIVIEEIIGFKIKPNDYERVNWTYKPKENFDYLFENKKYPELKRLQIAQRLASLKVDQIKETLNHSLSLNLSYTANSFNEERDQAFRDANSSENEERSISLVYSIPLGAERRGASKDLAKALEKKNKLDLINTSGEILVQTKSLKENVQRFTRLIEVIDEKVDIADKVVNQNSNLYRKGKVSFEEMLRAEENLISTKINKINIYAAYEQSLAKLAYINGDIIKFLNQYVD